MDFATATHPLRCSALPLLVACPWRAVMLHESLCTDESGKAADTGSAVHKAVYEWHRNGHDLQAAIAAMEGGAGDYPLADFHDAALSFKPYTRDPRNVNAEIVRSECKVTFTLRPSPNDPTQELIHVRGTLDQIRRRDGCLYLDDLKTGKKHDGWAMMNAYAMQIAAYAIGATQLLNVPVLPGAIIRSYGYRVRGADRPENETQGVFFNYAWGLEEADALLDAVRNTVAAVRAEQIHASPGEHCGYCPAGGLDNCLIELRVRGSRK